MSAKITKISYTVENIVSYVVEHEGEVGSLNSKTKPVMIGKKRRSKAQW